MALQHHETIAKELTLALMEKITLTNDVEKSAKEVSTIYTAILNTVEKRGLAPIE